MLSKIKDSKKSFKKITQHGEGLITPSKQMQLPFFKTSITKCRVSYISLYFYLLFLSIDYKFTSQYSLLFNISLSIVNIIISL